MNDLATPPPLPHAALHALREEASQLDVEDILALCFAFSKDPRRLKVYLDVLRGKAGIKAQAAACLVCFDLARQGDARFEAEFMALIPVMAELAQPSGDGEPTLAERLVGGNGYLQALWTDLAGRLRGMDPRADPEVVEVDESVEAVEVSLFDEGELADLGLDALDVLAVDDEKLRGEWMEALGRFCDWDPDPRTARADAPPGFFADHKEDLRRLDRFEQDARSLEEGVAAAAAMRPLVGLFLATHTRSRTLFGTRNRQRDAKLEEALLAFAALKHPPDEAAAWLMEPTAAPFSWDKVAEALLDYLAFLATLPDHERFMGPAHTVPLYTRAARPQPAPTVLTDDPGQRRRR